MDDDSTLLHRYAGTRSAAAFAELVRRHGNPAYAVALRQVGGDAHLAQDVTQAVFTAFARKSHTLTRRPTLTGWLDRSTCFAASDVARAERRRRALDHEAYTMHALTNPSSSASDLEKLRPLFDEGDCSNACRTA